MLCFETGQLFAAVGRFQEYKNLKEVLCHFLFVKIAHCRVKLYYLD